MILRDESPLQKTQRLQLLKAKAQEVLSKSADDHALGVPDALQTTKLLEDLRIYQVELEIQNEELRASQQEAELVRRRYQTLFDQMPLAAMVVDDKGVVDDSNERANALLGNRKRFINLDGRLWQRLNRNDRGRMHVALRNVGVGESLVIPKVVIGEPGATTPVFDVHLIGLSIDYKLDRRVLMLLVDRTAEVARQQDQRFYSLLLDSSDSLIYAFDAQGNNLLANQALLDLVHRPREEVLGKKREMFMPLRDAILHADVDQKVLASGQAVTMEEQAHMGSAGSKLEFLTRKFPLHDVFGKVYGVGGISTDITAIKDHQRQALLSETVFMASDEAIIITDAATRIQRVNPAFSRLTGFSAESVLGRQTRLFKTGRHDSAYYQTMWQALEAHRHWAGEFNNRHADGSFYTVWCNINAVVNEAGELQHYIALQSDVTQLHETQVALAKQAAYDSLTGLPNRSLFNERITQMMALAHRHHQDLALLFVDLDRFKEVNDTLGHQVGDELLKQIAQRLQLGVRTEDTVARIGGDEFVVLLPNTHREGAEAVGANLLERLRQPVTLAQGLPYRPMASLGVAVYPQDGDSPDLLLRSADLAMYGAKVSGRNRMASYTASMSQTNDLAFAIQTELAQAVAADQLRVHFQPKCRLSDGALMGAEALVRWERPGHGLVLPGEFIGVAEKCGLLVELDRWVLDASLSQLSLWIKSGLWQSGWRLAVNQNVADLQRPLMLEQLQAKLSSTGVSPHALELEITEDALMQHTPEQLSRLQQLRDMGISLAIDDFGTGYSSLSYLRKLPVSVIKIDMHFVAGMVSNDNDAVLVRTIVDMAHNLSHSLVAEGIEREEQRSRLASLGCELGQGYLFGRAVDATAFAQRWFTA